MQTTLTIPRVILIASILTLGTAASCTETKVAPPRKDDSIDRGERGIRFSDVAVAAGVDLPPGPTWGSLLVDYDRNGWPDLLIGRHKRHARLFDNTEGSFALNDDPALSTPPPGRRIYDRHGCAWGEANGDGLPDLYCSSGAQDGQGEGPNQLLLQTDDGFSDVAPEQGVQDSLGRGRSAHWMDYDRDGDLDVFVTNEIRSGHPNVMFRNEDGSFDEVEIGLSREIATRSSSWSDWDNDGDPDILVLGHGFVGSRAFENIDGSYKEVEFPNVTADEWLSASWGDFDLNGWTDVALVSETRLIILRNRKGRFDPVTSMRLQAGRTVAWLDLENDGDLDAYVLQGQVGDPPKPEATDRPDILLVNEDTRFRRTRVAGLRGPRSANGDSVAVADFDRDGRVDLHVTQGYLDVFGSSRLLRNQSSVGNWIAFRLKGPNENPLGIGMRVTVETADSTFELFLNDGIAFKSQSEIGYVHFGIANARTATIRLQWPDGSSSCAEVKADQVMSLGYGTQECE